MAARIGQAVKASREQKAPKLSAARLAEATERCGYAMTKAQISDLELGRKKTVTVPELIALALALELPPVQLLYPNLPDGQVEVWPNHERRSVLAAQWFSGELSRVQASDYAAPSDGEHAAGTGVEAVELARKLERYRASLAVDLETTVAKIEFADAEKSGDLDAIELATKALERAQSAHNDLFEFVVRLMVRAMGMGMVVESQEPHDAAFEEASRRFRTDPPDA